MNKTDNKFLSLTLAAIVLITAVMLDVSPLTVSATAGEPDVSWYNTSLCSFAISTVDELAGFAQLVNDGISFDGKTITLDEDIDISSYGSNFNNGKGWVPIGVFDSPFEGDFIGNNHKITGLYINDNTLNKCGLFGYLNGTIKSLGVEGSVKGLSYVGGVVAVVSWDGIVENCYFEGTVKGEWYVGGVAADVAGKMENCYSNSTVTCTKNYAGGIMGIVVGYGNIKNCYSAGNVIGDWWVGGVAGKVSSSVSISMENCYSMGDVVGSGYIGGVVGEMGSKVKNCYATGAVSGEWHVGGIVGSAPTGIDSLLGCVALNSEVNGKFSNSNIGRIAGDSSNRTLSNCRAFVDMAVMVDGKAKELYKGLDKIDGEDITMDDVLTASFWTGSMGWSTSIWDVVSGRLPILKNVGGVQVDIEYYGDINADGLISVIDVVMSSEIAAGFTCYTADQITRANVSSKDNAAVDIADVVLIIERVVGGTAPFPAELK